MSVKVKQLFLSLFLCTGLWAQQEILLELDYNVDINNISEQSKLKSANKYIPEPIVLPFIDDFSYTGVYPDYTLWSNQNATINNNLAKEPVTMGVITLDAMDGNGRVYNVPIDSLNKVYQGDVLTSAPILLQASSDVYLSFYYEAGGYGEIPDESDSLLVQFYLPDSKTWETVWKAVNIVRDSLVREYYGNDVVDWKPEPTKILNIETVNVPGFEDSTRIDTTIFIPRIESISIFKGVILPVNDVRFIHTDTFKFRFVSHFSLGEQVYKGRIGNTDMWHIDYVKLDANRNENDTLINDISFVYSVDSIFNRFTSIPAKHSYTAKGANEWSFNPKVYIKNNYGTRVNFDRRLILKDVLKNTEASSKILGDTIFSYGTLGLRDPITGSVFDMLSYLRDDQAVVQEDSARFIFNYVLTADEALDDRKENDTLRHGLLLKNFYAYDDGSPEKGYGLTNASSGKVAVLFEPLTQDTLQGVYMYFNKPLNDNSFNTYIKLTVWNQDGEMPGDTLYSREIKIQYEEGINKFKYFELDSVLVLKNPFYVGWIQMKDEFVNIGYDSYRDNSSRTFRNFGSGWAKSSLKGSIMIRPVFGKKMPVSVKDIIQEKILEIYPNPVQDMIYVKGWDFMEMASYGIFDLQGRIVKEGMTMDGQIDCSDLKHGIYIFGLQVDGSMKYKKIIVAGKYR